MCICALLSLDVRALLNPVSNHLNEWKMLNFIHSISSPSKEQHYKQNPGFDIRTPDSCPFHPLYQSHHLNFSEYQFLTYTM